MRTITQLFGLLFIVAAIVKLLPWLAAIGAAWAHEKGAGYSIRLDALPIDGLIVLVEPSEKAG